MSSNNVTETAAAATATQPPTEQQQKQSNSESKISLKSGRVNLKRKPIKDPLKDSNRKGRHNKTSKGSLKNLPHFFHFHFQTKLFYIICR